MIYFDFLWLRHKDKNLKNISDICKNENTAAIFMTHLWPYTVYECPKFLLENNQTLFCTIGILETCNFEDEFKNIPHVSFFMDIIYHFR